MNPLHRTIRAGLTGGIGSGKSTVCRMFALLGVPVYDTDARAKALMEDDPALAAAITAAFGSEAYRDGMPDRAWLAGRVFGDKAALARLNSLVHPAVTQDILRWAAQCERDGADYVLVESAILFESRMDRIMDRIITVSAPGDLRIERSMKRDGATRDKILARMANQMSDTERESRADFIIHNDERSLVWQQVLTLDEKLRNTVPENREK